MLKIVLLALYLSYLLISAPSLPIKTGGGLNPDGSPAPSPVTTSPTTTTDQGSGADPWG